jgi:hypothetical protein
MAFIGLGRLRATPPVETGAWYVKKTSQEAHGSTRRGFKNARGKGRKREEAEWALPHRMDTKLRRTYNQPGDRHEPEAEEI